MLQKGTWGSWFNGKLSHCALATKGANHVLEDIRYSILMQPLTGGIVLLCSVLMWPHLESCVQIKTPQYRKDIKLLESTQKRATSMMKGFELKPCGEQLRSFGLFGLEETEGRPHWGLQHLYKGKRKGRYLSLHSCDQ